MCVVCCVVQYGVMGAGGSFNDAKAKVQKEFWPVMKSNWMIWPAVQLINFRVRTHSSRRFATLCSAALSTHPNLWWLVRARTAPDPVHQRVCVGLVSAALQPPPPSYMLIRLCVLVVRVHRSTYMSYVTAK
jgi:hypothetical protein